MLKNRWAYNWKRLWAVRLVLLLVLLSGFAIPDTLCFAADTGSVCVKYHGRTAEDREISLAGTQFLLYQVGSGANGAWELMEPFRGSAVSLSNGSSSARKQQAAQLYAYAKKEKLQGTLQKTDGSGTAVFPNLKTGLYLLAQTEKLDKGASGIFDSAPFLVSVPGEAAGEILWNVIVEPKSEWKPAGTQETEKTPSFDKLGQGQTKQAESQKANGAQTGDHTPIERFIAAGLLSAGILFALGRKKRKARKP